jgi:hypothetical protein
MAATDGMAPMATLLPPPRHDWKASGVAKIVLSPKGSVSPARCRICGPGSAAVHALTPIEAVPPPGPPCAILRAGG